MSVCSGISALVVLQPKRHCCNAVTLNPFVCSVLQFWTSFAQYSTPDLLILVSSSRSRYISSMNLLMLTGAHCTVILTNCRWEECKFHMFGRYNWDKKPQCCWLKQINPTKFQVQITLSGLTWCHKPGKCAKSYARRSMNICSRNGAVPVVVCLRNSCSHVTEVEGPSCLWDSCWSLSCKMLGTLRM